MTMLSLFPQVYLWHARGRAWAGAHAYFYTDEPAYAAYVNALVDGRPRRNDPYTGADDTPAAPQPESLFSIQFIPAYLIALPARALGLSTATAFILLAPIVAFTTSLALFWLLAFLMEDERAAAAFVPCVLSLGILLTGNGLIRALLNQETSYVYLPFLRRYIPAAVFPFFILFFPFAWLALNSTTQRRRLSCALAASLAFIVCLYGYFYLWTAAAGWLALITLLCLIARPASWRELVAPLGLFALLGGVALVPYSLLLTHRARTLDVVQALNLTHAPDLARSIEACALVVTCLLLIGMRTGRLDWRNRKVLCALSFAVLPFLLFNQQLLTGRSLQPMHYEQFVTPYLTLVAAALTCVLLWRGRDPERRLPLHVLLAVAYLTFLWGAGETWISTRRFSRVNVERDRARIAALRLRALAHAGENNSAATTDAHPVVFTPDINLADNLPMVAPQAVLWSPHMFVFSGVTVETNKERIFKQLYYTGVDAAEFERNYRDQGFVRYAVFGWARANPKLTNDFRPVTDEELDAATRDYAAYVNTFDRTRATQPTLTYLLVAADQPFNFQHLDRWYTHDQGERAGHYLLYRLQLRP
jgi:hypothetical protein